MRSHPTKMQGKWEHKYTQPKHKTKANNQQKLDKDTMQRGFMTTKRQSMKRRRPKMKELKMEYTNTPSLCRRQSYTR